MIQTPGLFHSYLQEVKSSYKDLHYYRLMQVNFLIKKGCGGRSSDDPIWPSTEIPRCLSQKDGANSCKS